MAMAVIITALMAVILLLNYYPYRRITVLFGLARPWPLAAIFFLMAISFPIAMFISRRADGPLASWLYIASATWLGTVFFGCAVFLSLHIIQSASQLLGHPLPPRLIGWLSVGLTLAGGLYGILNAATVRTTRVNVKLFGLASPVRIVQLSDVHLGAVYGPGFLKRLVVMANALKPDLVAVTGDLFDGSGKLDYIKVRPLEWLTAPAFFVTGNHENYEGADQCCDLVARAGVRVLRNEMAECAGLQVVGMDAPRTGGGQGKVNHFHHLANMPAIEVSRPAILLYHIPLGLEQAAAQGVDLMLCGHTHNGQIFPFTMFMPLTYRFFKGAGRVAMRAYGQINQSDTVVDESVAGMKIQDSMMVYISQGAGTWGPPMRIGSVSEIVVIDLIPE